jgi:hypothetical protein
LHRLGIQAFQPILVQGRAIHLHPSSALASTPTSMATRWVSIFLSLFRPEPKRGGYFGRSIIFCRPPQVSPSSSRPKIWYWDVTTSRAWMKRWLFKTLLRRFLPSTQNHRS